MITLENIQLWGLTRNQAKVLKFFVENRNRTDLSFKKIKNEIKSKKSFYREVLQDLIEQRFLFVLKDRRPITYHFNENRFKEFFQEKENSYIEKSRNFDLLFEKIKEENNLLDFLKLAQAQLSLSIEQIEILKVLISKINDNISPKAMTLKKISQNIKEDNTIPTIRYNLALLEKRGFVSQQKIGRINYYRPKSLKSIIETEQKFQENLWTEKKKRMNNVIQFFQKTPKKAPEKLKNFEVKTNIKEIKEAIIKLIKNAVKEIFFDFRCGFERTNPIKEFLTEIFYSLLEILREENNLNVKIILNIDDWLIHKFDNIFLQLIMRIQPEKLEIRVPIDKIKRECRLIVDEKTIIQAIGVYEFSENENCLVIEDNSTIKLVKFEFNKIWENSLDIRDTMAEYAINKELEKAIKGSERKYPIKYDFTDKIIIIPGLKIGLKFYLHLIENAKNEIITIQGPIFKTGETTLSVIETLSKDKFYDKLNMLIPKKIKEGIIIKWIRNITIPHLAIYPKDEMKKLFMDLILSLYPGFQMRQNSFEQFQFMIIDQKILCFFEYSEYSKIILIYDNFLIQKYLSIFQKLWFDAYDIRLQWLTEISQPLQEYIKSTFKKMKLQIPMSKENIPKRVKQFII